MIKDFISKINDNNKYDFCINLRNKFNSEEIYKIEVMLSEEREEYLKEFLSKEEYMIYEIFISNNKFIMEDFIDYLNRLIELNDLNITILVPSKNMNFNYINNKINTKVSDNIYKGIKILYRNKVYDFSLN